MHWYSMSVFIQLLLKSYYVQATNDSAGFFSSGEMKSKWVVHKDNSSTFVEYLLDDFTETDDEMSEPLVFPHPSLSSPLEIGVPFPVPSMLPAGGTLGILWTKPSGLGERYQVQFPEGSAVMSRREGQPGSVAWRPWLRLQHWSGGRGVVREELRGSGHTWLNCAAMSEGSHILELVVAVPPFSFLGAMQRTGGALASKLASGPDEASPLPR